MRDDGSDEPTSAEITNKGVGIVKRTQPAPGVAVNASGNLLLFTSPGETETRKPVRVKSSSSVAHCSQAQLGVKWSSPSTYGMASRGSGQTLSTVRSTRIGVLVAGCVLLPGSAFAGERTGVPSVASAGESGVGESEVVSGK